MQDNQCAHDRMKDVRFFNCVQARHRFRHVLGRRKALGLLAVGCAMALTGRGQATSNDGTSRPLRYIAYVDGERSGTQDIEFVSREQGITVMSSLCVGLDFAFVTLYRFRQSGQEDWKDGKLVAFEYVTYDDGDTSLVSAQRDGSGNFLVISQNGQRTVSGDAVPASFWNRGILDHSYIIDPQTGELSALSVQSLEQKSANIARRPIHGSGYAFRTYVNGAVWFDEDGRLLALTFDKNRHKIELLREFGMGSSSPRASCGA
jgi:uncharacterized protein DUF6134